MKTRQSTVALFLISHLILFTTGCFLLGAADELVADAAGNSSGSSDDDSTKVQNETVRRLLEKLDDTDADPESIRTVRRMLIQADKELSQGLAGNGRSPRQNGSFAPPKAASGGTESDLSANQAAPNPAAGNAKETVAPNSSKPGQARTPIVEALLTVLDEIAEADKDAKDAIRDALTQADSQLSQFLGGKSKERILQANRKAPVRVPVEPHRSSPGKAGKANQDGSTENENPSQRD